MITSSKFFEILDRYMGENKFVVNFHGNELIQQHDLRFTLPENKEDVFVDMDIHKKFKECLSLMQPHLFKDEIRQKKALVSRKKRGRTIPKYKFTESLHQRNNKGQYIKISK